MPAYFLALFVYVALALLSLSFAALLAVVPRWRSPAGWLALGVAGSFPGVFTFQVMVVPFAWAILFPLAFWFDGAIVTKPLKIGITLTGVFLGLQPSAGLRSMASSSVGTLRTPSGKELHSEQSWLAIL
jgi:hypothetical protein